MRPLAAALATLLVAGQVASPSPVPPSERCEVATTRATLAADALRTHFWNETSGMWREILWWQAANSLEVIAIHAGIAGNATLLEIVEKDMETLYTETNNMSRGGPFLTGYFDDEDWWALGWLVRAARVADAANWLSDAGTPFADRACRRTGGLAADRKAGVSQPLRGDFRPPGALCTSCFHSGTLCLAILGRRPQRRHEGAPIMRLSASVPLRSTWRGTSLPAAAAGWTGRGARWRRVVVTL